MPAIKELTDLDEIKEGGVECTLEPVVTLDGRRLARVALYGTVRGTNEDGPNRQTLDGFCYFDLQARHLSYLYLKGVNVLLDKDGKELGRIEGKFTLTRDLTETARDLDDNGLRGLALEPDAENTRLLYDNPELGVRFLHPRRWRVAAVRGGQVALDSSDGNGLLLTVEPTAKVPTAAAYLAETRDYLQTQKAKVLRGDAPRPMQGAPRALERFTLEAELGGQRVVLDYYVGRQDQGDITLAARLLDRDLAAVRRDVEAIARSVTLTRRIEERPAGK